MFKSGTKNLTIGSALYMIGTIAYLFSQWLISVVIVNVTGLDDAGYFGLAMTITSVFSIVACYGVRSYQISDINCVYADNTYVYARIVTTCIAFLLTIVYSLIMQYDKKQTIIIAVYMVFKCCESMYDVFHGILQKNDKLYSVGISLIIKGVVSVVSFCLPFLITNDLLLSLMIMALFAFALLVVDILFTLKTVKTNALEFADYKKIFKFLKATFVVMLMICCTPLFATIPRIILEKVEGRELLGVYTSLATPAVLLSTVASTLFLPIVPSCVRAYNNGNKKYIQKKLFTFSLIMVGLGILACLAVMIIGEWAINLVYGEIVASYYKYMYGFIINMIFISVTVILNNFCTGIRKLKQQFSFMALSCLLCLIFGLVLIPKHSILGAVIAMIISQIIHLLILGAFVYKEIKKI